MSPIDSPRESCSSSPRRTIGVAPSSATPTSKEIRVLVEGRSKTSADAAAGQVARRRLRRRRPAFSSSASVEQLAELERAQLFACEEVLLQAGNTKRVPKLTAIAWNLFHGRDFPPDPELLTWRSRLLRITERNATHAQVNRDLSMSSPRCSPAASWDVALLQESPPRFAAPLARACGAEPHRVLTSRNGFGALRGAAARLNPDLIASGEGGSNLTLVRARGALGPIEERRELAIHEGRPERRAMALTRTASGVCVANLHASTNAPALATEDVLFAAREATEWAGAAPLLFGGDLNLRPRQDPEAFEQLAERFGLRRPDRARRDRPSAGARPGRRVPSRPVATRATGGARTAGSRCASPTTRPVEAVFETARVEVVP